MNVAECINGRGENHMVTHGPECFYCGQIPTKPFEPLRAALVAIQELHKPILEDGHPIGCWRCDWEQDGQWPCSTRRLADDALTARTTKNGDNK